MCCRHHTLGSETVMETVSLIIHSILLSAEMEEFLTKQKKPREK